jgi:hypothetical protein
MANALSATLLYGPVPASSPAKEPICGYFGFHIQL